MIACGQARQPIASYRVATKLVDDRSYVAQLAMYGLFSNPKASRARPRLLNDVTPRAQRGWKVSVAATRFRYTCSMRLTLDLPDELSAALAASGDDISRAAFEAIALEAYRERKLTTAQLRRLLGFESRYELDGFLKQHEVWLEYTWQDLEQDREAHRRLGL